jgi:hypothetical protein
MWCLSHTLGNKSPMGLENTFPMPAHLARGHTTCLPVPLGPFNDRRNSNTKLLGYRAGRLPLDNR